MAETSLARRGGKPTLYTPELAERICLELSEGRSLCDLSGKDGIPDRRTVHEWVLRHPEFAEKYAVARELGCDALAEELLALARERLPAERITYLPDGGVQRMVYDDVNRARLMVDTWKWILSKLSRRYAKDEPAAVEAEVVTHVIVDF